MMPLTFANVGEENMIKKVGGKPETRKFLENLGFVAGGTVTVVSMDMGITKGVEVHVRKVAPLGDPIEVTVRGYELSLRKADAEMIETV